MNNPKTTTMGFVMLLVAGVTLVLHALTTGITAADIHLMVQGLGGLGLLAATDGGL